MALKFRPARETPKEATRGKLPCAEAASVQQVKSVLLLLVKLITVLCCGLAGLVCCCTHYCGSTQYSEPAGPISRIVGTALPDLLLTTQCFSRNS